MEPRGNNQTLVAEPIALKLRQYERPQYMPVSVFVGFIFLAATICVLLLRALAIEKLRAKTELVVHVDATTQTKSTTKLTTRSYEKIELTFAIQKV